MASSKHVKNHEFILEANWKKWIHLSCIVISARWNTRIRIRFWIGFGRNDNVMHQKPSLFQRILFLSQIGDWRKTQQGPYSIHEETYDKYDIKWSRNFSFKIDIGFHISDDIIIFELNLNTSKNAWNLPFKNWIQVEIEVYFLKGEKTFLFPLSSPKKFKKTMNLIFRKFKKAHKTRI